MLHHVSLLVLLLVVLLVVLVMEPFWDDLLPSSRAWHDGALSILGVTTHGIHPCCKQHVVAALVVACCTGVVTWHIMPMDSTVVVAVVQFDVGWALLACFASIIPYPMSTEIGRASWT